MHKCKCKYSGIYEDYEGNMMWNGKLQLCPQGRQSVRQRKQTWGVCFSCENQWAEADGSVFPHYLLLNSVTNVFAHSSPYAAQVS